MAAEAQRALSVREQSNFAQRLRRFLTAIEPWYDWGPTFINRMDANGEGPGRFVELQWFGLNITVYIGRTPKAVR